MRRSSCDGPLRTPASKRPPLYLTEFGYRSKPYSPGKGSEADPNSKKNTRWHTEATRAAWLRGVRRDGVRRGALDNAVRARASWLLYYQASEHAPTEAGDRYGWETGIIGFKPPSTKPPNDDIRGYRGWGKWPEWRGKYFQNRPGQFPRQAYCAIREWARTMRYAGVTRCPARGT